MFHNIKELETGEMAEQLGATIALSEDLTWFPAPMKGGSPRHIVITYN